jgi:hypothetical protein
MPWSKKDAKAQKAVIQSFQSHICDSCALVAGIKPAKKKLREGKRCYTCDKYIHNGD